MENKPRGLPFEMAHNGTRMQKRHCRKKFSSGRELCRVNQCMVRQPYETPGRLQDSTEPPDGTRPDLPLQIPPVPDDPAIGRNFGRISQGTA
jgi:hypothetical protein